MPHQDKNEKKNKRQWVIDIIKRAAWPMPSDDLYERIMMSVESQVDMMMPNVVRFPYARMSPFLALAFVCAFGLGSMQIHNCALSYDSVAYNVSSRSLSESTGLSCNSTRSADLQSQYYGYGGAGMYLITTLGDEL